MMAQNGVVVVGIDVAKDKVDGCIRSLSQRQTFPSTAEGRHALIRWLRKHKIGKAAMEASGGYERDWAKALREAGIEARIVDPKRVRSFAKSAGRLAKNDPIDAEMIAWFAETFVEAKSQTHDAARQKLVQIVNARQSLLDMQTSLQNRSEHSTPEVVQKMQRRLLKEIASEVAELEAAITAQVKATPHFVELAEIIESVPGLGKATSAGLIAAMPELGQVSDNIAAALLGVAPYDDDSGQRRVTATSKAAAARSATSSTWRVSGPRPSTTPCSRRSMPACSPRGRSRRLRSPPACASSSSSSTP
jgi:transposase